MGLQINRTLTTNSGFDVATGSYVWIMEKRGTDREYKIEADVYFFKNKAAFDLNKGPFYPAELQAGQYHFEMELTPANFGAVTSLAVHQYVETQLEAILGVGTITIVQ